MHFSASIQFVALFNFLCCFMNAYNGYAQSNKTQNSFSHQDSYQNLFVTKRVPGSLQSRYPNKSKINEEERNISNDKPETGHYAMNIIRINSQWHTLVPFLDNIINDSSKTQDLEKFNSSSQNNLLSNTKLDNVLQKRASANRRCISLQGDNRRKCFEKFQRKIVSNRKTNIEQVGNRSDIHSTENNVIHRNDSENINSEYNPKALHNINQRRIRRIKLRKSMSMNNNENIKNYHTIKLKLCSCYWHIQVCGCNCKGSLNYDDFMDLSKIFHPCQNFSFSLSDGYYYALPPNLFSNLKLVEHLNIFISNATFEYLLDPTPMASAFSGVQFGHSAVIRLNDVNVRRSWNWAPLEELRGAEGALVDIQIEDCILKRLTSDFSKVFSGQVQNIDIDNSELSMVGSAAFETFENMTYFRVPNNRISILSRVDFPKIPLKLTEIDLRNNLLRNLDKDLFLDMPSLKEVSLSGNPFIVLSENTFQNIINKVTLKGISDFSLYCDCRLQWLKDSKFVANDVIKRNLEGATCRRPGYLRGALFDNLSKEHLICY